MRTLIAFAIFLSLVSCNMEKEIDLKLPDYESKMVVEAYLIPGEPFRLSIVESVSYFEAPTLPTVDSALVTITYNGITDTLKFDHHWDPINGKFYNYKSPNLVPFDYTSEFNLYVKDKRGRIATAKTIIPPPITIDTVQLEFNKDSVAYALTKFKDDPTKTNYYRYYIKRTFLGEEVIDYQFDDKLLSSSDIAVGSNYNLEKGTEVIVNVFHITKEYFDFLETVNLAIDANGNPFGQPAVIKSNINGGLGIFTGLALIMNQNQKLILVQ